MGRVDVENNAALYTTIMMGLNTLNEYYRVFKTQIDAIEAHDGNPGYHLVLAQEHLEAYMENKELDTRETTECERRGS